MKESLLALGLMTAVTPVAADRTACSPILDVELRRLAGDERVNLCEAYQGQVVLIVNTASKCGFTPQYEALEGLYRTYRDRGLVVLGIPSNDFASQEPGTEQEIQTFCKLTYAVEFPMFEKVHVKKGQATPLFDRLAAAGAPYPKWNFFKYLLDRDGNLVDYYISTTSPSTAKIRQAIEKLL